MRCVWRGRNLIHDGRKSYGIWKREMKAPLVTLLTTIPSMFRPVPGIPQGRLLELLGLKVEGANYVPFLPLTHHVTRYCRSP